MSKAITVAADLTAEWLTDVLAPHLDGAEITAVTARPVGTGQVSDSLRLHLTYDRPAPLAATIIAKIPAAAEASRAAAKAVRTYEVEASFYAQIAGTLDASVPACYFSAYDAEDDRYVVLLDDLAPAEPGDQIAGITPEEAAAAVDEMAVLHATGWNDPDLAALPWLNRNDAEASAFTAAMVTVLYDEFKARYASRLEPQVIELIERFLPSLGNYLVQEAAASTLAHGDFRADNLLFGGARPVILDWQTCAFGPGGGDLAYFLGSSLPVQARRDHEEALVRRHHSGLTARGVSVSWDDCWDAYRRYAFHGVIMGIGASTLVERTARGDDMFCTMITRHAHHALDLDALSLLP
ncbi:phosphotransferase [Actinocorallia longicatena]|uniref:CHK kinase-like domain-containing protein n=1 Tax=Actinocorallia longicatena TaxID=111803 RepID=A0ABP6QH21_9ACTN